MLKDDDFYIFDVDYMNGNTETCIFKYDSISFKFQRIGEHNYLYQGKTCDKCKHTNWNLVINDPRFILKLEDIKIKILKLKTEEEGKLRKKVDKND